MASDAISSDHGVAVRKTGLIDRVSISRVLFGIPMYAFNDLESLEWAYEADKNYGRHLYERDVDWNSLLPSPIPFSVNGEKAGRQVNKGKEIKNLWDKAKEAGIIEKNQFNLWQIKRLGNIDFTELEKEAGLIAVTDVTRLNEFSKKLEDVKKLAYASQTDLDIDISNVLEGYEEVATFDFLIKAPKLVEVLTEEIQLREALNNLIAETDSKRNKAMGNINLKSDFFNAIFTGVIKHEPLLVKYVHSNYGIEEEFILSNPDMKYGRSATYQAFLNFADLKPEIRDSIIEEAKKALTSDAPEVVARTHEAMDFISSKLELLVNTAYRTHASLIEIKDEVDEFYKDFMKEYNEFRIYHV